MSRMKLKDGPLAGRVYMMPPGDVPGFLVFDSRDGWRYFYGRVPSPGRDEHGTLAEYSCEYRHPLGGVTALPPDGHPDAEGLLLPERGEPSLPPAGSDSLAASLEALPPRKPLGNMVAGDRQETGAEALARLRRQGAEDWRPTGTVGAGDVPGARLQSAPGVGEPKEAGPDGAP